MKKDQKAQQADTGAPLSPPEAEVAESPFTVTSLSSHLSVHIASNASYLWCIDSGASAHMTMHCHWLKEIKPHKVPIELADNSVVYSEGIGTVIFFFNLKTKNYLPYFSLMFYMFPNFKTTSSQSSS